MRAKNEKLEDQVPEYGLEALVSVIDDNKTLIAALKEAGEHFSMFKQRLDGHMT
ncbi:MAG TPA: hypothetical protein VN239_03675 [Nitrososphaera sp.]|jgi:hypothetical protein|nr:hypothetical protein [Nitrososphaera sp.]